ncbi:CUB domain-containing protein [Aphelenchoides fujianensis]|nr:CUB domain-containing protein [Aphelenchoides fujianensis]
MSMDFLNHPPAAAVGEPQQIAICGEGTEVADREPESLAATSATGVLSEPNSELDLVLAPNGTWPVHSMYTPGFETKRCALRIEACAWCTINVKVEPASAHFTDYQIDTLSKCEKEVAGLQKSCFNLELIEEKADPNGVASGGQMSAKDVFRTTSLFGHAGDEFESTSSSLTATGIVESVRFPNAYPRHLVQNVTLVNKNATGFVRLTFDDFHLSSRSELRILDSDGRLLFSTRGEHRRPPAVVSNGPRLQLLFFANGATQPVGFRARYQFVAQQSWAQMPNCDGLLENAGGQITLNGRTDLLGQNVDCVWTIAQLPAFSHAFDQTRLRVEEFGLLGSGLSLEVRKGVSSGPLLLLLTSPQDRKELLERQPADGFAVDSSEHGAFYIRLRGLLTSVDGFSIVYAQFYRWATASCLNGEFHCTNGKCISPELRCDKLDHCGDQTDEQTTNSNRYERR